MLLAQIKITLVFMALLVGGFFGGSALANEVELVFVEQDDAGQCWKITVPDHILQTKNLYVELDVLSSNMDDAVSYFAWKDELDPNA